VAAGLLDEEADQPSYVFEPRTIGEILQRRHRIDTRTHLRIHQCEFGREFRMADEQFVRNPLNRLRETQPRFDADHHEIQCIRKGIAELPDPRLHESVEHEAGREQSDG